MENSSGKRMSFLAQVGAMAFGALGGEIGKHIKQAEKIIHHHRRGSKFRQHMKRGQSRYMPHVGKKETERFARKLAAGKYDFSASDRFRASEKSITSN